MNASTTSNNNRVVKTCYNLDGIEKIEIILCAPRHNEECPISVERIGSLLYVPPYVDVDDHTNNNVAVDVDDENDDENPSQAVAACQNAIKRPKLAAKERRKKTVVQTTKSLFFSEFPHLSCAEITLCGHRFDVRALLIHFMRNGMRCPLCRAGVNSPLSCRTSFPSEVCMLAAEIKILAEKKNEENNMRNEDELMAGRLQNLLYVNLPSMILDSLSHQTVTASLFFYDTPVQVNTTESSDTLASTTNSYAAPPPPAMIPIHGMQFELELQPLEAHHRGLSRGISLYSSFSSSSIETPRHDSRNDEHHNNYYYNNSDIFTIRSDYNNDMTTNNNNQNDSASSGSTTSIRNDPLYQQIIHMISPGGEELFSIDDITVQYAMSESTLRRLSRSIREFGALSIGGIIHANHILTTSRRHYDNSRARGPMILSIIETFNLNPNDAVELLRITPPGNLVSIRSQEEREDITSSYIDSHLERGGNHHSLLPREQIIQINRFEFVLDSRSLMRMFLES